MDITHGGFVGTPNFASPEQFESGPVDVRSDIYSLGATLWFALTGKTPFAGRNIEEIRRAHKSESLPMEQLKAARVPSRLRWLLKSMLALEPVARPGVNDLGARLRRCSAQASGMRRTGVALTAAVILILGVSAFFVFRSPRTQNSASNPAVLEKRAMGGFVVPMLERVLPERIEGAVGHDEQTLRLQPRRSSWVSTRTAKDSAVSSGSTGTTA